MLPGRSGVFWAIDRCSQWGHHSLPPQQAPPMGAKLYLLQPIGVQMPRERQLASYANDHYMQLIRAVVRDGQSVLVKLTQGQAATLRGEIYAWRRVAEKSPIDAVQRGIDIDMIRRVAFRIGPDGLRAIPQSELTGPSAIEAAIGEIEQTLTPANQALNRLKNLVQVEAPKLPYDVRDEGYKT